MNAHQVRRLSSRDPRPSSNILGALSDHKQKANDDNSLIIASEISSYQRRPTLPSFVDFQVIDAESKRSISTEWGLVNRVLEIIKTLKLASSDLKSKEIDGNEFLLGVLPRLRAVLDEVDSSGKIGFIFGPLSFYLFLNVLEVAYISPSNKDSQGAIDLLFATIQDILDLSTRAISSRPYHLSCALIDRANFLFICVFSRFIPITGDNLLNRYREKTNSVEACVHKFLDISRYISGEILSLSEIFSKYHHLFWDDVISIWRASSEDSIQNPTWKDKPHFVYILSEIVSSFYICHSEADPKYPEYDSLAHGFLNVVPLIIVSLLEDYEVQNKMIGMDLYLAFLAKVDAKYIVDINMDESFYKHLSTQATLLSEIEIVKMSYTCLFKIGSMLSNVSKERHDILISKVVSECLLVTIDYAQVLHKESYKYLLKTLSTAIKSIGILTAMESAKITSTAINALKYGVDIETMCLGANLMHSFVENAWPRAGKYSSKILVGLAYAWPVIVDINVEPHLKQLASETKHKMKETVSILKKISNANTMQSNLLLLSKVDPIYLELIA